MREVLSFISSFFIILFFKINILTAQTLNIDSLINILDTKEDISTEEQLFCCMEIAIHYSYNDIELCEYYTQKGMNIAQKERNKSKIQVFNNLRGNIYQQKALYDSAIVYYESALELAIELDNKKNQSVIYTSLGGVYGLQNKLSTALKQFLKALSISQEINDKINEMYALGNIATIHRKMHNDERALYYLEQVKEIAEEQDFPYGKCRAYYDMGSIYKNKKEYDKAFELIRKVVDISTSINHSTYEIVSRSTLAQIYLLGYKDYNKAEDEALKSKDKAIEYGDPYFILSNLNVLSGIYLNQGKYAESRALAKEAWNMNPESIEIKREIIYSIIYNDIVLGHNEEALDFLDNYHRIVKEYNQESFHQTLIDMEVSYETEKKDMRINTLEKEKVLYIWLGIISTILLLSIISLLFIRRRLRRKEKEMLITQSILEGETTERARLARDLHDSLGGMLSVVKLNMNDTENLIKANEMLDRSIVELRRVAHHLMPESLLRTGLKDSLEDFCRTIPNVRFQYFGDNTRIDNRIETLIYLCAQELINNAIKHAQAETISVQLIQNSKKVSLTVEDDGKGFDVDIPNSGMGLNNIKKRIAMNNGLVNIFSSPGKGTEIYIELNL